MRRKKKKVKLAPRAIFENCCLVGFAAVKDVHSCFIALQIYVFCFYTQFPQTAVYLFCWPFSKFLPSSLHFLSIPGLQSWTLPKEQEQIFFKRFHNTKKINSVQYLLSQYYFFVLKFRFTLSPFFKSFQTDNLTNL